MKSHDNPNFDINSLKCLPSFRCLCFVSMSWTMTAWAIGIIIAVVAVLLTHMDRKHVINMKPSINLQWLRGISWTDLFIQKTCLKIKSNKYEFFSMLFFMQIGLTGIKQSIFNLLELRSCKPNRDLKIFGNFKGVIAAHPTVVCWENGWTLHV